MTATAQSLATEINAHLKAGGFVLVSTAYRSTKYTAKHAGWFFLKNGALHVNHGRGSVCLSMRNGCLLVDLRFSK